MKKRWSKALSLALAVSMCVNGVPMSVQSDRKAVAATEKDTKADSKKKFNGKNLYKGEQEQKKSYVEGEAIVMYRNTDEKKVSIKKLVGSDIQVESTCDFSDNGTDKKKVSAKSVGSTSNGLKVSLVKSDKYTTKQLIAQLSKSEDVMVVEPNYVCKAENAGDYKDYLWALDNKGQNDGTAGEDLNADALANEKLDENEKVIAIVDTGVDYDHKDLEKHMWNNPYTDQLKGAHGYDFVYRDADPKDENGHGTHCAGIITGKSEDNTGIKGVAADANVKIMALRFLDENGYGSTYDAISAYNYIYSAQKLGVNVVAVNNSWGGTSEEEDVILEKVMNLVGEKGAISVVAAGNDSVDNDKEDVTPANYESPYIISVAASQEDGDLADFSDYGKKNVDLAAPGADILSSVSYDCFTPTLYEDKDELCSYYEDFSNEFEGKYQNIDDDNTVETNLSKDKFQYTVVSDGEGTVSVEKDSNTFFGKKEANSSSLRFSVKNAKEGEYYTIYIPYEIGKSNEPIYHNFMIREDAPELGSDYAMSVMGVFDVPVASGGAVDPQQSIDYGDGIVGVMGVYGKENYWTQINYPALDKQRKAGTRALALVLAVGKDGDYNLYFDDLGVSKENVKSEKFGKYAFYNGTSMATPYVTGTVALAKALYPNESAVETRSRVIGSTTKKDSMKNKTATEGVLDLGKIKNPNPVISGGSISADGTMTVEGAFFKDDTVVEVNGQKADIKKRSANELTFKADFDKELNVVVKQGEYTSEETFFFVSGKEVAKNGVTDNRWGDSSLVSNGDKLYRVAEDGRITIYDVNNKKSYITAKKAGYEKGTLSYLYSEIVPSEYDLNTIFGKQEMETIVTGEYYRTSDVVSLSKELYSTFRLDLGYSEKNVLIYYNPTKGTWTKVADVPKDFNGIQGSTLVSYKGKLYLLGGYNNDKSETISTVYSYDVNSKKWNKEADMPAGRFMAKALQANGKLVVTLGGDEKGGCATNYLFDGTTWKTGASLEGVVDTAEYRISIPYKEGMDSGEGIEVDSWSEEAYKVLPYYTAAVGYTDTGLIYTGLRAKGLGNTFTYEVSSDTFKKSGLKLTTANATDDVFAGTIGTKFYIITGQMDYEEVEYYEEYYGMASSTKNLQELDEKDYGFGADLDSMSMISSIDIAHKTIRVAQQADYEGGYVYGVGNYDIGDTIKLTAVPYENYFVKSLSVNGKTVKNGYTVNADSKANGMKVSAVFGKYVTEIALQDQLTLEAGSTKTLSAMALPEDADNKTLTWSSSDTSVVTVDQKGNVKAKANAAGKSATIKVEAKDRKTVVAYCDVEVVAKSAKVAVKKITLTAAKKNVKAGKSVVVKAGVSPSNATNKSVKWASSKKKYATVNSKGKVTAKKAGKGHTVTITATSVSDPKVKGSIKIKIK